MASDPQDLPPTLLDLLSNSLILRHTAPFLPVHSLLTLAAASKDFQSLVLNSPECHRYVDLSPVKAAATDAAPIDVGGTSWRHERMDEALTEDEFYSGPLRGIFAKLERRHILQDVYTLVLDGLTVPADLVREIIAEDRFQVRILSIREVKHLNERKLRQVLEYAVRPTRPEGTPKLRGLYVFGPKEKVVETHLPPKPTSNRSSPSPSRLPPPPMPQTTTRTTTEAISATSISSGWNQRSHEALKEPIAGNDEKWYQAAGQLLKRPYTSTGSEWAATLKACEGIIRFDAVLCRGPRHDLEYGLAATALDASSSSYLPPTIASIALGSTGCANCGSCPEGPATFGASPSSHLPLLSPPALQVATIKACQAPFNLPPPAKLIVRCESCLKHRWCERCHKWWCEDCFTSPPANWNTRTELQQREAEGTGDITPTEQEQQRADAEMLKMGVKRECFGCGHNCAECIRQYIRACRICKHDYCVLENESPEDALCDWCHFEGRRTRELY